MAAPFSLIDLAETSISTSIVDEASKSTRAVNDMAARGATTMGSSTAMGSTRMGFSCDSP